ncbi:hypothetical protein [Pelagicoccus sp. SDUM812005]|uniref:hypothetical protein n=1 Tax=Pelagicoccus sp. SDUM812005 TaxID=3041257 RepID=UPI00280F6869|nr:hypothetical protein [Pelagicoccus sp. SDUM812005]MDQ8181871.1 hypothetical protein [Pelagicoccus sp. SDUM812005]
MDSFKDLISQLTPLQIGVASVAFIFLLIGLRLVFKKPPAHLTAFSGEAGSVLVSRKALQELIRSACLLDEWVEAARPTIRLRDNKVTARVEIRLTKPEDLKAICERVQAHITALLQKSLSFDQIGQIEIVVKSFGKEAAESEAIPSASSLPAPETRKRDAISPKEPTRPSDETPPRP